VKMDLKKAEAYRCYDRLNISNCIHLLTF